MKSRPPRPLRLLLMGAAGLAGIVLILAMVALLPSVQRSLLRQALVRAGAGQIQVESFRATPFGLTAGKIAFVRGELEFQGENLAVRFHPLALLRHRLTITQATARSILVAVDLAAVPRAAPAAASAGPKGPQPESGPVDSAEAAAKSLAAWRAPLKLVIDGLALRGRLEIRRGPSPVASADWALSGGGLKPGAEGAFDYRISASGEGMPAAQPAVLAGRVTLAENQAAGIGRLGFGGQAQGLADELAPSLRLKLDFDRPGPGEAYRLSMGLDMGGAQLQADLNNAGPAAAPVEGELRLAHVPASWANRWLHAANLSATQGELNLAWKLSMGPGTAIFQALELPPDRIQLTRADGRALPPLWIQATPSFTIGPGALAVDLKRLRVANEHGWAADLSLRAEAGPPPIEEAQIGSLELRASRAGDRSPVLTLKLAHPRRIRFSDPPEEILRQGPAEIATFSTRDFPLAWVTRFLPGRTLAGTWTSGESVLRSVPGQGLALATTRPWTFENLRFEEGGKTYFAGRLEVSPSAAYGPGGHWLALKDLLAADDRGARLAGHAAFGLKPADDQSGGGIDIRADLPHVPGSGGE